MGKIVRQGVEYGGSSNSADCIKYNDTKSVKEAIDEIKASSSSDPTAASVTFNNTDTGLNATNVQDAVTEVNGKLNRFGNLNVKSTNNGSLPNIIQRNEFYLIVAKRWTVSDAGIVCLCDWVDGSEPRIYIVQKSDTFSIATNSNGTITAMYNGYTSGVYLTVMRLY